MRGSTAADRSVPMREKPIGRDVELESLGRLADGRLRAVVLFGEAGIGKTTLWRRGVELSASSGCRTLVAAPAEQEATLPFAALADLLESLAPERFEELPEPQRQAVLAAIQNEPSDAGADTLAVSRAVLALVRGSAREEPLLVAVDDVQWLDQPSRQVLEFVARRIRDASVRLLVAQRADADVATPLALDRALVAGELERVSLGPLRAGDLDELIRLRLGLRLPRSRLIQLERLTEGNPFYALEIARSLASAEGELSIPRSLTEALATRVATLPPEARDALLLAAASVQPTADVVERAAGGRAGLAAAMREGVIEIRAGRLRFSHPLLASVVAERALPGERRDAHRRLAAAAAADSEERAVHLARGHDTPDAAIAAELERTAGAAAARGGPGLAAELAEAAASLTPMDDAASERRRLTSAAEYHEAEGDPVRGRQLLEQLIDRIPPGRERAALLMRLSNMREGSIDESIRLCEQALDEAGGAPTLIAEIHTLLGLYTRIAGDPQRSLEHCRASVRYAEEAGDERQLAMAIGDACTSEAMLALPWNRDAMARAREIEPRLEGVPPWMRPSCCLAGIAIITDDLDMARPLVATELERARRLGHELGVCNLLLRVADLEVRAGRWSEALQAAREAHALARQGGLDVVEATTGTTLAFVLAHVGELAEARSLAKAAHRVGDEQAVRTLAIRSAGVLGFVELQTGGAEPALVWLTPAREELQRLGIGELSISGVVQNEIDALVALGRLEEAEEVIAFVEEKGRPAARSWHEVVVQRGRALVASARGDVDRAREHLDRALAAHERLPQPFELGRTLIAQGSIERRAKHRAAARESLTRALELFDTLGAPLWAEKAAAELARIPGRGPAPAELSETQRRIAELVTEGLSNKEIAARLFVTVRTVEANLTKIYEKLGIHSRTELAAHLSTRS